FPASSISPDSGRICCSANSRTDWRNNASSSVIEVSGLTALSTIIGLFCAISFPLQPIPSHNFNVQYSQDSPLVKVAQRERLTALRIPHHLTPGMRDVEFAQLENTGFSLEKGYC